MIDKIKKFFPNMDWILVGALVPLLFAGLITMKSFTGETNYFLKQSIWIIVSFFIFFTLSRLDFRFLRKTGVIMTLFTFTCAILLALFVLGKTVKGSTSWFNVGFFSFQPADLAKITLILLLSKYFTKRHVEIANVRHILLSGFYSFILFLLVLLQPDLGSALIILSIWFGMILFSGISKKHLGMVFLISVIFFGALWQFGFKEYQKQRILTFLHPLSDIRGAGYNAYQSTIAVGSGQIFGKGIGYGTQSRLNYLPEYQTDFIFAAFAEEWGFVGVIFIFIAFSIFIFRLLDNATLGETNFEMLFGIGIATLMTVHFIVNVGMNIGILPVTGVPLPFVSYGGSHLLTSFIGLGILMGMRNYRRAAHKGLMKNEFLGI